MKKIHMIYGPGKEEQINKREMEELKEAVKDIDPSYVSIPYMPSYTPYMPSYTPIESLPATEEIKNFLGCLEIMDKEIQEAVQLPKELLEGIKHPYTRSDCNKIKRWFIELWWLIYWKYGISKIRFRCWFEKRKISISCV